MWWKAAIALLVVGCSPRGDQNSRAGENFDLLCDSSDTQAWSTLFCARIDTRTGDVVVIDLDRIPTSNGSTKSADAAPGTYKLVCDSTDTPDNSVFHCIRLNTDSGDLLKVRLPSVKKIPE